MVTRWQAEQSLSPMDDFPLHQIADTIRNVGSSDRNFYDRYYFNMHNSSGELFMVMGMGQYPTLAVQDAFVALRKGDTHRVVRASRELSDRADTAVGPIRVEVLEGLQRVRFVLEPALRPRSPGRAEKGVELHGGRDEASDWPQHGAPDWP